MQDKLKGELAKNRLGPLWSVGIDQWTGNLNVAIGNDASALVFSYDFIEGYGYKNIYAEKQEFNRKEFVATSADEFVGHIIDVHLSVKDLTQIEYVSLTGLVREHYRGKTSNLIEAGREQFAIIARNFHFEQRNKLLSESSCEREHRKIHLALANYLREVRTTLSYI